MDCCTTKNKVTLLDYARELHRLSSAILKDAETLQGMEGVISNETVEGNLYARINSCVKELVTTGNVIIFNELKIKWYNLFQRIKLQ